MLMRLASIAVLAGLLFCGARFLRGGVGNDATRPAIKRGVSVNFAHARLLKASWYYNWYIDPVPGADAEFVPMIAHGDDANPWYFDRVMKLKAAGKITCLLGFNEPDRGPPGGDISVQKAIEAWPMFERTGLRLGSPAAAYDIPGKKWLNAFMTKANEQHLRVDFIAVHWYGDLNETHSAEWFIDWLGELHNKWHKPIWITEFAGLNWDPAAHPVTAEMNQDFLKSVQPLLDHADWLERYCWFSTKPANLFANDDGGTTLTRLGEIYRDGGK